MFTFIFYQKFSFLIYEKLSPEDILDLFNLRKRNGLNFQPMLKDAQWLELTHSFSPVSYVLKLYISMSDCDSSEDLEVQKQMQNLFSSTFQLWIVRDKKK